MYCACSGLFYIKFWYNKANYFVFAMYIWIWNQKTNINISEYVRISWYLHLYLVNNLEHGTCIWTHPFLKWSKILEHVTDRKTTAVDDRNMLWKKAMKNISKALSDILNNIHRDGVKVSQSSIQRKLQAQKYICHTTTCNPLISSKNQNLQRNTEMCHKSSVA